MGAHRLGDESERVFGVRAVSPGDWAYCPKHGDVRLTQRLTQAEWDRNRWKLLAVIAMDEARRAPAQRSKRKREGHAVYSLVCAIVALAMQGAAKKPRSPECARIWPLWRRDDEDQD